MPAPVHLTATDLQKLPPSSATADRRACCGFIVAPGWESLPAAFRDDQLRLLGTLRPADAGAAEVLDEYHPAGTRLWSADAPVAPRFFPYNQSEVWLCTGCGKPFLRYAENGGYYHEDRIRELDPALVVDAHYL